MTSSAHTDLPFAIVPEWLVDSPVSDRAFRVYALLARYADSDGGGAIPSRRRMAERLDCSVDTIDRALGELIELGAIVREHRFRDGRQTSNEYVVRRIPPEESGTSAAPDGSGSDAAHGSGTDAAGGSGTDAAPRPRASMTESQSTESTTTSLAVASDADVPRHRRLPEEVWSVDVLTVTRELAKYVRDNGHALPKPASKAADGWYDAVDKLLRLGPPGDTGDDPPPAVDEVRDVMKWALVVSDFWPANVRSASKFRQQYTTLRAQSRRAPRSQPPGVELATGYADAAARLRSRA